MTPEGRFAARVKKWLAAHTKPGEWVRLSRMNQALRTDREKAKGVDPAKVLRSMPREVALRGESVWLEPKFIRLGGYQPEEFDTDFTVEKWLEERKLRK